MRASEAHCCPVVVVAVFVAVVVDGAAPRAWRPCETSSLSLSLSLLFFLPLIFIPFFLSLSIYFLSPVSQLEIDKRTERVDLRAYRRRVFALSNQVVPRLSYYPCPKEL